MTAMAIAAIRFKNAALPRVRLEQFVNLLRVACDPLMADSFLQPFFVDRRSEPRRRVDNCLIKLDPGRGRTPITCFVWDVSEGGTRLKMSEDIDLPPVVHVIIGDVRKAARVVWRKADHVGLQYLPEQRQT
jgi:hypothetical protein